MPAHGFTVRSGSGGQASIRYFHSPLSLFPSRCARLSSGGRLRPAKSRGSRSHLRNHGFGSTNKAFSAESEVHAVAGLDIFSQLVDEAHSGGSLPGANGIGRQDGVDHSCQQLASADRRSGGGTDGSSPVAPSSWCGGLGNGLIVAWKE